MMKQSYTQRTWVRLIAILIACHLSLITASAQQGLHIAPLFEGKIVPQERMVETRVKGKMLSRYQLSSFRSVRFEAKGDEARRVHDLIEQDRQQQAGSQQGENWHSQKSHATETMMLQLPTVNGQNRFLIYKRRAGEVTVIYMEGRLSSLDTLKDLIK